MFTRKQKKSEGTIARIKNTEPTIKHPDKKAVEWMRRKPYEIRKTGGQNENKEEKT